MQTQLDFLTNRDLFSNYYLSEHLPETEDWEHEDEKEVEAAYSEIESLYEKEKRWQDMVEGGVFFRKLLNCEKIPHIAVENPVMHKWGKKVAGIEDYPDELQQTVQPWQFGEPEKKGICLWLKDLPKLEPTDVIEDETGKSNTLFFLTASSGLGSNPEFRKDEKLPGGRFKHHYVVALLESYLNVLYGEGEWIRDYRNQQIFLNRTLIEDAELDIKEVSRKASRFILSYNGIAGVLTSDDLIHTNYTEGIYSMMQNSFHQKRSGDIIIALKPGWIKDFSYTADHNSAYRYDTHVPLIFYGWKTRRTKISRPVNITDIVPSICNMMNIPLPGWVSGIPIEEISR